MKKNSKTLLALSCLAATTFGIAVTANVNTNIKPANAVVSVIPVSSLEMLKSVFASETSSPNMWEGASLTCDIITDETLYVGPRSQINLDLNGYVLSASYDDDEKYSVIEVDGKFSMYNSVSSATTREHTGEYASLPCGSVIAGGKADKGGAICVNEGGYASIDQVTIVDNYANQGGGIYCGANLSVGKYTKIYNNKTLNGENQSNVYLEKGTSINLSKNFFDYNSTSYIGVDMEEPGVFSTNEEIGNPYNSTNYRGRFFSDDDNYKIAMSTNHELKLQIPETINISVEHGKVVSDPEYFVEGDTVTLKTIADDGYVIDEIKVNNGEINLTKKDLNTYTFLATDSTSATAKFVEDYATKITWNKRPANSIVQGQKLDLTGVSIKAHMASEKIIIIDVTEDMISGFDSNKAGNQKLTVTYQGKTTTFTIRVEPKPNKFPVGLVIGASLGAIAITVIIVVIAKKKKKKEDK